MTMTHRNPQQPLTTTTPIRLFLVHRKSTGKKNIKKLSSLRLESTRVRTMVVCRPTFSTVVVSLQSHLVIYYLKKNSVIFSPPSAQWHRSRMGHVHISFNFVLNQYLVSVIELSFFCRRRHFPRIQ